MHVLLMVACHTSMAAWAEAEQALTRVQKAVKQSWPVASKVAEYLQQVSRFCLPCTGS